MTLPTKFQTQQSSINFLLAVSMLLLAPWLTAPKASAQKEPSGAKTKAKTYKIVGNSFSLKFHQPQCEFARKMNIAHVRLLHSTDEALALKYKACNWCFPRWSKSVSSRIVSKKNGETGDNKK